MSDSSSDPITSNEQEEIQVDRSSTPIPETPDEDQVRAAELLASMKDTPETQYSYPDDDDDREPFEWDFGEDQREDMEEGEIKEKQPSSDDAGSDGS